MSDDEDDWFTKDEDEIFQNFQISNARRQQLTDNTEYIAAQQETQHLLHLLHLEAAASDVALECLPEKKKYHSAQFAKILNMPPVDIFIRIMTEEEYDFFDKQISPKDPQIRVLHYTQILAEVCRLQLPGFELDFLQKFISNYYLLTHYRQFVVKLFSPMAFNSGFWNDNSEALLIDLKYLLLRAYRLQLLDERGKELLGLLKCQLNSCKIPEIMNKPIYAELAEELSPIKVKCGLQAIQEPVVEFYPTIDELLTDTPTELSTGSISSYLAAQLKFLREDFMSPLREFVQSLYAKQNIEGKLKDGLIWPQAHIILNPDFKNAKRHGLIFVDLLGEARALRADNQTIKLTKEESTFLEKLKNGSLICFSSDYNFSNLILATVTFTESDTLSAGYFGIEIQRQYNIGNVYGKPFIMFETPVFFEPYYRVYNYLSNFNVESYPMIKQIINGGPEKKLAKNIEIKSDNKLNEAQCAALKAALNNNLCLIQGPPGTGKTELAVELICTLVANKKKDDAPIVVVAYTNDAIDKLLLKISKHTESILRFGSQTRIPEIAKFNVHDAIQDGVPRLKRLYWLVNTEYKSIFEKLQILRDEFDGTDEAYQLILNSQNQLAAITEKLNTVRSIFHYYVARDKAIIAMTTTCAAKLNFLFHLLKCKIVIFEEAAEILESHVLACITPYTEIVTMIGDHKQLKPYTNSTNYNCSSDFNVSLFERLLRQNLKAHVLDVQYRMRPNIAALLCPEIYEKLINADIVNRYDDVRFMSKNLYFLTHNEPETKESDLSFTNDFEARKLCELAAHFLHIAKYSPEDIIILTPYLAQLEHIRRQLFKVHKIAEIKVATVDSFQGLEANIVLLSLVRSNSTGNIGFLRYDHRICVALSRAKYGLYMIGNMSALTAKSDTWMAIEKKLLTEQNIGYKFPIKMEP